ncbi:hypothetical protein HDU67_002854 [Dinochytrium kinnereticum]|nr:hypothetical protein HDU67_002854 [Dinochytrium kinnereticum]
MHGVNGLTLAEGFGEFTSLFRGVVVDLDDPSDAVRLKALEEVRSVIPVREVPRPTYKVHWSSATAQDGPSTTHILRRRDIHSNNFTGVTEVLSDPMSLRGFGIRVCVVDTGVDYRHPALGGCFGVDCKVAFGYDFVGDAYNPGSRNVSALFPRPDNDPMDCSGHGTHVAGIVGALDVEKKGAEGVAPDVTIGAYKIFGCDGNTDTATILSAIERAMSDGCDVMNLSLGGGAAWYDTEDSELVDLLAERGIVIVASAGNDQDMGLFRINSPAVAKNAIAVGSVENTYYFARTLTVVNETRRIPFVFPVGLDLPLALTGVASIKGSQWVEANATVLPEDDGCRAFAEGYFGGSVALIRRGTCLFTTKIRNAHAANASAIIIYNRLPTSLGEIPNPIPGFPTLTISGEDGEYLVELLRRWGNGRVGVRVSDGLGVFGVQGGGRIAEFSSWGLNNDWSVKPDIVAPGGHILSTWPLKLGGYAVLSGTSMSSPFISGLTALFLSQSPYFGPGSITPATLKQLLQTTSTPTPLLNQSTTTNPPLLSPVALQGSGLVDIRKALNTTTFVSPASLAANASQWDREGRPETRRFLVEIRNADEGRAKRFRFGFREAAVVAIDDPSDPRIFSTGANTNVTFSPPVLAVTPNATGVLEVFVTGPLRRSVEAIGGGGFSSWMFSGYIVIQEECDGSDGPTELFHVSLAGVVGDFDRFQALDLTLHPPFLSRTGSGQSLPSTNPNPPLLALTLSNTLDNLAINLHLLLPSPKTIVAIFLDSLAESAAREQARRGWENPGEGFGEAVAVSPLVRLPVNDADDAANALYSSVIWDGSRDFSGGGVGVASGRYRVVVVCGSVYGGDGGVVVWSGGVFEVVRG